MPAADPGAKVIKGKIDGKKIELFFTEVGTWKEPHEEEKRKAGQKAGSKGPKAALKQEGIEPDIAEIVAGPQTSIDPEE